MTEVAQYRMIQRTRITMSQGIIDYVRSGNHPNHLYRELNDGDIAIYASKRKLELLKDKKIAFLFLDGTFKSCPVQYQQEDRFQRQ